MLKKQSRRYTQFGDSCGVTTQYISLLQNIRTYNKPKPGPMTLRSKTERILKSAGKQKTNRKPSLAEAA